MYPLLDGILAFILLISLQYLISTLAVRSKKISHLVKATPTLLVYKGQKLMNVMGKERINEDEVYAIVREKGYGSLNEIDAIVLETDGSLTLIKDVADWNSETMRNVKMPDLLPDGVQNYSNN